MKKIMIVHASISENGTINGKPGDQTRGEVCERELYDRGWRYVLRPKNSAWAVDMARQAKQAAVNDNIGYGQADRLSLWEYVRDNKITELEDVDWPVNCDCSSLIAVLVKLQGINIDADIWTGNMFGRLTKSDCFDGIVYDQCAGRLLIGDILLAPGHTAIVVQVGEDEPTVEFAHRYDPTFNSVYWPNTLVNVRTGPGLDRQILRTLGRMDPVRCYGYFDEDKRKVDWLLTIDDEGRTGWISRRVLSKELR